MQTCFLSFSPHLINNSLPVTTAPETLTTCNDRSRLSAKARRVQWVVDRGLSSFRSPQDKKPQPWVVSDTRCDLGLPARGLIAGWALPQKSIFPVVTKVDFSVVTSSCLVRVTSWIALSTKLRTIHKVTLINTNQNELIGDQTFYKIVKVSCQTIVSGDRD